MKFFSKKAIAGIVAFCLIFALAVPAGTARAAVKKVYDDVSGHKYEDALLYVIENGLMSNTQSKIYPDSNLTKGAACLSLNALLGATVQYENMDKVGNLKKGDKYYNTVSVGLNCGYLKLKADGGVYSPLARATYGYLADIFSSVLGMDMSDEIIGSNNPKATLTRGEYAAILQKLAPNIVTKNTFKVGSDDVYITKPNVELSNTKVDGNLIITDAVGDQDVTLRNVEVTGELIVRGGGENSIYLTGTTAVKNVIVQQVNNPVSVKVVGSAKVDRVQINNGSGDVKIQGKVSELNIAAASIKVSLEDAKIENVEVSGKGTVLAVSEKTEVQKVVVNKEAEGTKLEVSGFVKGMVVAAKDSAVNVLGKGKIEEVKAEKTAGNFSVTVDKDAVVSTVNSEADNTVVAGEGNVENAVVTGEGSNVATEGTNVTDSVQAPTPAPSGITGGSGGGGSGGGGGSNSTTTDSISISEVKVVDAKTITVKVIPQVSGATVRVNDVEAESTSYESGTYTVTLKEALTYGTNYTVRVSKSGYTSGSRAFSGSSAPQYGTLDTILTNAANSANELADYAEINTSDIANGKVTLTIKDERFEDIAGTGIVTSFATLVEGLFSNNVSVKVKTDSGAVSDLAGIIAYGYKIVGSSETLGKLAGTVLEAELSYTVDGLKYTKAYTMTVRR